MRCTSPLFVVNNKHFDILGKDFPSIFKKKIYGIHDYKHFVDFVGVPSYAFTRVNCGQCMACRINKAREWSERCYLESKNYESNYFVTLTYDDNHLVYNKEGIPTLYKRDLTLFWKRLRKYCSSNGLPSPRYFACGEYGDLTFRPHYHCILFNLYLEDLEVYKVVKRGTDVYTYCNSNILSKLWNKGFAVIAKVTPQTLAYTARYSLKKVGINYSEEVAKRLLADTSITDSKRYACMCSLGQLQSPFNVQSQGIGGAFAKDNLEVILETDSIPGCKIKHIRYFDKLMERTNPDRLVELKDLRAAFCDALIDRSPYNEINKLEIEAEHNKRKYARKQSI